MDILFNWCGEDGVIKSINIIRTIIDIVRIVVPIGLVVMTTMDIFKKVINPDDKDGQKKILNRIIAGLIVFFVPILVRFVVTLAEKGGATIDRNSCLWELIK